MSVNQAVAIAVLVGQLNVLQTGPSSGGMQAAAALGQRSDRRRRCLGRDQETWHGLALRLRLLF